MPEIKAITHIMGISIRTLRPCWIAHGSCSRVFCSSLCRIYVLWRDQRLPAAQHHLPGVSVLKNDPTTCSKRSLRRLHVALWCVHRPQRDDIVSSLRPRYVYSYMEPFGRLLEVTYPKGLWLRGDFEPSESERKTRPVECLEETRDITKERP